MEKPRKHPEYLKFQYENLVPQELFLPQVVQYGLRDLNKSLPGRKYFLQRNFRVLLSLLDLWQIHLNTYKVLMAHFLL